MVPALLYKATERGYLQASTRSHRTGMVDFIKKHLKPLAIITEEELEEALNVYEVDVQATSEEDM